MALDPEVIDALKWLCTQEYKTRRSVSGVIMDIPRWPMSRGRFSFYLDNFVSCCAPDKLRGEVERLIGKRVRLHGVTSGHHKRQTIEHIEVGSIRYQREPTEWESLLFPSKHEDQPCEALSSY